MRKLVESNLIEKTKTYEEQAYRRWHLQRDDSAFHWGNDTAIGKYILKPKQLKPYCHTETTLRWTSGSTFELELELPKASENLSQFRLVYRILTGNKITYFHLVNKDKNLVLFWNLLGDGSRRLSYSTKLYGGNSLSNTSEFWIIIDYMQGTYNVYLTDDPDI